MIQNQNSKASEKYLEMSKELISPASIFSTWEKHLFEYDICNTVWVHEL